MKEDNTMSDVLSVAELNEAEKQKVNQERTRKLTQDRKEHHNGTLSTNEGLKTEITKGRINTNKRHEVIDDDFEVDLTRVRKLKDVIAE